jgi:hypothetical protein
LRMTTKEEDLFIAVTYIRGKHEEEKDEIYETLKENVKEIGGKHSILITGDLNSAVVEIGGKENDYGLTLGNFLDVAEMALVRPPRGEKEEDCYTRVGKHEGGTLSKSALDHILVKPAAIYTFNRLGSQDNSKGLGGQPHPSGDKTEVTKVERLLEPQTETGADRKDDRQPWRPTPGRQEV